MNNLLHCYHDILLLFTYARMVSIFHNRFKTESLINSEKESHLVYSGIFRLLKIFEKKVFKTRAVCHYHFRYSHLPQSR